MTTSFPTHHHLLVFFSCADDDKPFGSSSSLGFFLKCKRQQQAKIPTLWRPWLFCLSYRTWQQAERLLVISWFFPQMQKTTTSQDPNYSMSLVVLFKLQKTTTSRKAPRHLLVFSSSIEDDNKLGGSSSSLCFFLKRGKWRRAKRLIVIS